MQLHHLYETYANMRPTKRTKYVHGGKMPEQREVLNVSPTLVPCLPEPLPPTTSSAASQEELGFFDKVKKHIGNKNTMSEFLKLCNLYSQDLLSKGELANRAQAYIGGNTELMSFFKSFLKYDDKDVIVENRPRVILDRPSLPNCRGLTPSYRLLPRRVSLLFISYYCCLFAGALFWLPIVNEGLPEAQNCFSLLLILLFSTPSDTTFVFSEFAPQHLRKWELLPGGKLW